MTQATATAAANGGHPGNGHKGTAIVVGPEEGDSFWQPLPSTGHITAKITPYTAPYDDFASGIQVLEPGAAIREHGHQRAHELIFVYQGTGHAIIDGERHELKPETLIVVGRRVLHYLENEGEDQMRMLWVTSRPAWRTGSAPSAGRAPPATARPRCSSGRTMCARSRTSRSSCARRMRRRAERRRSSGKSRSTPPS